MGWKLKPPTQWGMTLKSYCLRVGLGCQNHCHPTDVWDHWTTLGCPWSHVPNLVRNSYTLRIMGSQVTDGLEIQKKTLQKNTSKPLYRRVNDPKRVVEFSPHHQHHGHARPSCGFDLTPSLTRQRGACCSVPALEEFAAGDFGQLLCMCLVLDVFFGEGWLGRNFSKILLIVLAMNNYNTNGLNVRKYAIHWVFG